MGTNNKTILVVEDDKALRTVLSDRFRSDDFEVHEAVDGEQGLALAVEKHPDLILLDIVMPKMDGIEMLAKLREDPWGKNANVMMLTNLSDGAQVAKVMEKGVNDYFVKSDWDIEGIAVKVKERLNLV